MRPWHRAPAAEDMPARVRHPLPSGQDVVDLEAEVMDRASRMRRDEFRDRRAFAERRHELDPRVRQIDENDADAMLGQGARRADLGTEPRAIDLARRVEVGDRDGDMIEPAEHPLPRTRT